METTDSQTDKGRINNSTENTALHYSTTTIFRADSVIIAETITNTEGKIARFNNNRLNSNTDIPFNFLRLRKDFIILY
jgi:hypothetical protein